MDRKEAAERIKRHMIVHQIGSYPHIKLAEALNMAIAALQELELEDLYDLANENQKLAVKQAIEIVRRNFKETEENE